MAYVSNHKRRNYRSDEYDRGGGYGEDVYEHMSYRDIEMNDRFDFAREVEMKSGDPERAAEIRMGA